MSLSNVVFGYQCSARGHRNYRGHLSLKIMFLSLFACMFVDIVFVVAIFLKNGGLRSWSVIRLRSAIGKFQISTDSQSGRVKKSCLAKIKNRPGAEILYRLRITVEKKDRGKDKGQIYCFFLSFILIINAYIDSSFCIACVACFTCIVYTVYQIKHKYKLSIWKTPTTHLLYDNLKSTEKDVKLWLNPLGCIAETLA